MSFSHILLLLPHLLPYHLVLLPQPLLFNPLYLFSLLLHFHHLFLIFNFVFILFSPSSPSPYLYHRKQAERAARGRQTTRRSTYFDCLVVDFLAKEKEHLSLFPSPVPAVLDKVTSEKASMEVVEEVFKETHKNGSIDYGSASEAEGYRMIGEYPWDDTPFQDPESPACHPAPAPAPVPTHSSAPPPVHSLMKNTGMKVGYGSCSNDEASRGESRLVHVDGTLKATDGNRYKVPQLPGTAPAPSWLPVPVSHSAPLPLSLPLPVPAPITVPVPVPPVPTSTQPLNYFSLYWIKKSGLPCIRTDWTNVQVNLTHTALPVPVMWVHSLSMQMFYLALPYLPLPCLGVASREGVHSSVVVYSSL
jgi:hypothetical protein